MHGSHGNIRQVHRDLSYSIFFYKPADRFYRFQAPRNHHRLSFFIQYFFTGDRVAFPFHPSAFAYIESDRVGPASRGGIQVNIISDQKITGTDCCSSGLGSPAIQFTGTEIRMPLFTGKTFSQSFIFSGPTSS